MIDLHFLYYSELFPPFFLSHSGVSGEFVAGWELQVLVCRSCTPYLWPIGHEMFDYLGYVLECLIADW